MSSHMSSLLISLLLLLIIKLKMNRKKERKVQIKHLKSSAYELILSPSSSSSDGPHLSLCDPPDQGGQGNVQCNAQRLRSHSFPGLPDLFRGGQQVHQDPLSFPGTSLIILYMYFFYTYVDLISKNIFQSGLY